MIEKGSVLHLLAPSIPAPILNFDGIPFPGVGCSCAPPDTNGDVGLTQYVQMVNEGYQVFDKTTGNSVLGPNSISRSGAASAGPARLAAPAIPLCFTINWPIAG